MESLLSTIPVALDWQSVLLSSLTAFVLSAVIAKVYQLTHRGMDYSRSLVQALVLGSIVAAVIMLAIGDNVARSIGIIGSLAIIRFRTNLRDPRDMVFVFAALGIGVACGVQSFLSAGIGTAVFCLAAFGLDSADASNANHDGLVRLRLDPGPDRREQITAILESNTRRHALMTFTDDAKRGVDCSYHVVLTRKLDPSALVAQLEAIDGIASVSYLNQRSVATL